MNKQQRGRARRTVAAALAAATVLAGCSTFTQEDFKTLLGGVGQVAQAVGEHEAARRAGRGSGGGANASAGQALQATEPTQSMQSADSAYAALACARVTRRGAAVCLENGCGGMVMLHGRSGFGTYGPVAVGAGQCAPVLAGTLVAVACKVGDRFDWQRSACVSS